MAGPSAVRSMRAPRRSVSELLRVVALSVPISAETSRSLRAGDLES